MASAPGKHSLEDKGDAAQDTLSATKQRKLDEAQETVGMDDRLYDIEVKLYSDAKAARNDPKPPGHYEQRHRELLTGVLGEDGAAGTEPGSDGTRDVTVGLQQESTGVTPVGDETNQHSNVARLLTSGNTDQSTSIGLVDDISEKQSEECVEDGNKSCGDKDEDDGDDEDDDDGDGDDDNDDDGDDDNEEDFYEHIGDDEEDENFDECEEWDWLEAINSFAYSKQPSTQQRQIEYVGSCNGKLIRRNRMRQIFHHEIEEPSAETSLMGFDLFDRYGRLKPEFKDHPIKKGSGIWGKELDHGDILLIETITVKKLHRRQGLGRKLVAAMLEKIRNKATSYVAISRPAVLFGEIEDETSGMTKQETRAIIDREEDVAELFLRSLGFRRIGSSDWFALAGDGSHPCHTLSIADDYDSPVPAPRAIFPNIEPLFESLERLEDEACLKVLQDFLQNQGSGQSQWAATDDGGNTLLHIAGLRGKPECVKWIMNQSQPLAQVRNHEGYTPFENLLSHLENVRTQYKINGMVIPMSDKFSGFSDAFVACSALLSGQNNVERRELLHLKYGCTCGKCISGFLSPRMHHVLLSQADIQHDMCSFNFGYNNDGDEFMEFNDHLFTYLPASVRNNLRTNKSMRQGFVNMWDHVATCLRKNVLPTESNVLEVVRNISEWPPVTRNYLQRGGTVKAAASMLFKQAMDQDDWSGDGTFSQIFGDQIKELPECRNDHEFGFVSGMCGYKRVKQIRYVSAFTGEEIDSD